MYVESVPNRNSPPAILLRESRREDGKTVKRTLANLSDWSEAKIDALQATEGPVDVAGVFAEVRKDRPGAAGRALAYLDGGGDAAALMNQARRLVFLKGNDAHDYKFSSAVLEDYGHVSPSWRNRFLASSLFYMPGADAKENALVGRVRAALGA